MHFWASGVFFLLCVWAWSSHLLLCRSYFLLFTHTKECRQTYLFLRECGCNLLTNSDHRKGQKTNRKYGVSLEKNSISSGGHKTKETYPTRPGSPTPCKQDLSNDDCDGNEDVKKAIGLLCKTTTLHVHHAFLYISLPSLHDYDVKMPNCKFYGGRKQATTNLFLSL